MKVWIFKRRHLGALLDEGVPIGGEWELFDLVVAEVTDQGRRRPTKVARLMRAGTKPIIAELLLPKLVYFKNWQFVMCGVEEMPHMEGQRGVAQTWLCKLDIPKGAVMRATLTHKEGVELPRRVLNDRYARSGAGQLFMAITRDENFGRHALYADLLEQSTYGPSRLADCCLDWMSTETFGLSGFELSQPYADIPIGLIRQGWLCSIEVPEVEGGPQPRKPKSDR